MLKALFIGEAYGQREERFDHPFVGASGIELARMLGQSEIAPVLDIKYPSELDMIQYWNRCKADCGIDITNVFQQHPAGNNIDLFFTNAKQGIKTLPPLKPGKYLCLEHLHHLQRLWDEVESKKPNLIIALGNTPCWAVLGETKISQLRGTVKFSPRLKCKVLPTYHPSAVLHNWALRPTVIADFAKCLKEMSSTETKRIERFITINPTLDEIDKWFSLPAEKYAIDIESGRALYTKIELKHMTGSMLGILSRQISMIGFARSAHEALVVPFMTRNKQSLNYWDNDKDETEALRLVQKGLSRTVPKIFQNGLYDIPMLLSYNLVPLHCDEDTMLLHHALYPESPKGLGFLGSIYTSEVSWKSWYAGGETLKRDD